MFSLRNIAKKIPDNVRSKRLLVGADPINNALPLIANPQMQLLVSVWETFIEPGKELNHNCGDCLRNILQNLKELKPILFDLEKEAKMMQML